MQWQIPLFEPDLGQAELDALAGVIRSKWLTMGELTTRFESGFAGFVGSRHAIAVSNGTAALHVALMSLGIGPGDEVICPSLTFVATANAIRYCGAKPVFADVESFEDWNISHRTIEAVITVRTRAIIVVHYAGYPCDMPRIMQLARSRGLAVVEDAAHAPGARLDGVAMGLWGDIGCFSFFSNKNMTTGEGGMLTTDRADLADKSRLFRSHGMTTLTLDRHKGHAFDYDVAELGYNYRMSELNAALGLVQLAALAARNERRRTLVQRYRRNLMELDKVQVPYAEASGQPSFHLFPVLLAPDSDRAAVMEAMKAVGVQTSIHYRPIDTFASYMAARLGPCEHLTRTHSIGARTLTLPLYPSMTDEQVDVVCTALKDAVRLSTGARS
jgi:dTDP-4-amino-4,6-dideoxygalactose transaminase